MGFCFFNADRRGGPGRSSARHGAGRILVADFDVHHGNGTQETFWEDDSVAYLSRSPVPVLPGDRGLADDDGVGTGTRPDGQRPARRRRGRRGLRRENSSRHWTACSRRFRPDLVLVSAGFDAHRRDPLGGMGLSGEGL